MENPSISRLSSSSISHLDGNAKIDNSPGMVLDAPEDLGIAQPNTQNRPEALSLTELEDKAKTADAEAKKCGVDIAKRGFFSKLLTLAAASAVLVAAALVTGLTGGAGIPLLALAGVGFAMAVGDVACAGYDWYNKAHGGEGMAMGGDSLGNFMNWLATKCGASADTAKKVATYGSLLTRGTLAVGTIAVGGFLPVATTGALHSAGLGISIGSAALTTASGIPTASAGLRGADKQKHEMEAAEAKAKLAVIKAKPEQRNQAVQTETVPIQDMATQTRPTPALVSTATQAERAQTRDAETETIHLISQTVRETLENSARLLQRSHSASF
ncbi:hypothetical protein [Chromobacterium amazonense]|uniref:hypothetical protein n=1 Tax=Chromobacterium amazonense TaxID=1382803 RepID=UPI0031F68E9B